MIRLTVLALLWIGAAGTRAETVDTRIDAVTVYRDGASVIRTASVPLSAGATALTIPDLPGGIDAESLRIDVATPGVALGQVRLESVQRRDAYDAEVRRLNAEIEKVERRISELDDTAKSAELQLKFLQGLAEGYAKQAWLEGTRGSADVASWQQALAVLGKGADDAHQRIRDSKASRAEAGKDLSKLKRELSALGGQAPVASNVHVTLDSARAQTVALRVSYFTDEADWSPAYEARLDSDAAKLDLTQTAVVEQTTEEPWRNVRLTLSTSQPDSELAPPELESQFLNLPQPQAQLQMKAQTPQAAARLEEVVVTAEAKPRVSSYAASYEIPGRVSVGNQIDDTETFDVGRFGFDVKLTSRLTPRLSSNAFLTAKFDNTASVPLYAASMQVFVDGTYAGETQMPTALPGAEVALPMGQDRRVSLTVRDQGGAERESGFIGRRRSELTDYLFEITNRHAGPAAIEVFDRYPVARNDDIEVTVPDDATEPDEKDIDDKPGVVAWRKTLGAGERWRIRHRYEVSYPADQTVVEQ